MANNSNSPVERDNKYMPLSHKVIGEVVESDNKLMVKIRCKDLNHKLCQANIREDNSLILDLKSDNITVPFTKSSYSIRHLRNKFRKENGKWVRYYVSDFNAMICDRQDDFFLFAPGWMVEGNLIVDKRENILFKFSELYDHRINYYRTNGNDLDFNYDI